MKRKAIKRTKASGRKFASAGLTGSDGTAVRMALAPIRQSVTIPGDLAQQIERGKQQDESVSKALLRYARLGITEEVRAKQRLREVVRKIQAAPSEEAADAYVDELTEALFGPQRAPGA